MMKKTKPQPVMVKAMSFDEILQEAQAKQLAEEAKFNAMTPAEQVVYIEEQKKKEADREAILQKLRGPGFMELRV